VITKYKPLTKQWSCGTQNSPPTNFPITRKALKMTRKQLIVAIGLLLIWGGILNAAWAGQVVTEDEKAWARRAIDQEKAVGGLAAPNTVAVLYFRNLTGQADLDPLQQGIPVMLITDLSKVKSLNVVERVRLQALVEELNLGASGLVAEDGAPRVGRLLGANWIVDGNLATGQQTPLQIKSSVLVVPAKQVAGQQTAGGILDDLFRMEKELLFEIIKLLKVEPSPQEEVELRKPVTTSIKALLDFSKGLQESDRGRYTEAAGFYERALKQDPGFKPAKQAIDELHALGLVKKAGVSRQLLRELRDRTSLTDQLTPEDSVKRERTPRDVRVDP
jgi:TolB-like protein